MAAAGRGSSTPFATLCQALLVAAGLSLIGWALLGAPPVPEAAPQPASPCPLQAAFETTAPGAPAGSGAPGGSSGSALSTQACREDRVSVHLQAWPPLPVLPGLGPAKLTRSC